MVLSSTLISLCFHFSVAACTLSLEMLEGQGQEALAVTILLSTLWQ